MSEPRVLVTAKAPRPGWVKTRLCPPFGLASAARIAGALLDDSLRTARTADRGAGLLSPADDAEELRRLYPDTTVVVQNGNDLAAALLGASAAGMTLVSGDAPDYPPELITRALESTADVVLGPSHDGGYCLLRTRMPAPELFAGISWSTRDVLDQTIAAARRLGRTLELLDAHPDVDTVADLRAVDLARAPATAAALQALEPAHALSAVPRVLDRSVDHESPWRRLVSDRLDTGQTFSYLETPAAVWVVPVSADGLTVLVRQYRHPIGWSPLEVPAGSVERGESAERAAERELAEEVGGVVHGELRRIGGFYSSSAHLTLQGLVYLATGVSFEAPTHAGREGIQLVRMPLRDALALARSGDICEAQTALALRFAAEAGADI